MPAFQSTLLSSSIYLETNFRWVNQSQDEFRQMKHSPGNQRIKRKNHTLKALCLTLHLWFWTAQWNQITHHYKLWGNIGLTTMLQINSRPNSSKTVTSHREDCNLNLNINPKSFPRAECLFQCCLNLTGLILPQWDLVFSSSQQSWPKKKKRLLSICKSTQGCSGCYWNDNQKKGQQVFYSCQILSLVQHRWHFPPPILLHEPPCNQHCHHHIYNWSPWILT